MLATFYVVGEIAKTHSKLVRDIHAVGHEVGSHSWDHRRVHRFTPDSFRDDLRKSKDALEQATGAAVSGFRAPTFSVMKETGWAIDVLAECGFEYDSSIFPVRHDRYGVPDAPRGPFLAVGKEREILELPLLTYRVAGLNLPVAGGGYFRLFPLFMMKAGLRQATRQAEASHTPQAGMLYFHPWEFDPDQPRLPLKRLSRWRTYVGVRRTTARLANLLAAFPFRRAIDVVHDIRASGRRTAAIPALISLAAKRRFSRTGFQPVKAMGWKPVLREKQTVLTPPSAPPPSSPGGANGSRRLRPDR